MENPKRQLTLYKGLEKFIFRYEEGQEDQLLDMLIEYAEESHTSFDSFDAVMLGLQLA